MKSSIEEKIETRVIGEFDVCVIGGSCTGVFAAIRAAQAGAKVALIEGSGLFGGVATAGMVNIWHSRHDTAGKRRIIGGLTEEVVECLKKINAVKINGPCGHSADHAVFNPAELAIELDLMVSECSSITPFLHTRFVRPEMEEEGRVAYAIIENKSGRSAVKAKCFVDASGDGDLIHRAGLPTWKGSVLQPPTTCAVLYGLESSGFDINDVLKAEHGGSFKHSFLWTSEYANMPEMRMVAATRMIGADCSDAASLTSAEMEGRRQIRAVCDIVRREAKPGSKFALAFIPSYTGVRETRHCQSLYKLTEADVLEGRPFDDAIAYGSYRIDIHHGDGAGITFKDLDGSTSEMRCEKGRKPEWIQGRWRPKRDVDPTFYQIPYRSLVPQGSKNVLCAGRLVDADNGAYGAVRVMVNCNQTGEAAGLACAMAADSGKNVASIDVASLRAKLVSMGAAL